MVNYTINGNEAVIRYKKELYPLDVIFSAGYVLLDKAYIYLDLDNDDILVKISLKYETTKTDEEKNTKNKIEEKPHEKLKNIVYNFNDELLNYQVYKEQSNKNAIIRQTILQRALLTNGFDIEDDDYSDIFDDDELEDPEDIMIPWDEKYGKSSAGDKGFSKK